MADTESSESEDLFDQDDETNFDVSPGRAPAPPDEAPRYSIPDRELGAVEVPAAVHNIDRAVKAFGRVPSLKHTLDPIRQAVPLYLNPESPFCKPIMSHNTQSHNVVLKVTVPKRTGRKRKRGTHGPWEGDVQVTDAEPSPSQADKVYSIARLDDPKILKRKLEDNVDRYQVQPVGVIKHTHRYRGLADFYWDTSKSPFAQNYVDKVLPGDIQQIKQFKFKPGVDHGPNVDVIPPPIFTHMSLPFNYNYAQNPYVRITEDGGMINTTAVKLVGHFIGAEDPAPEGPKHSPDMTDIRMVEMIAQLEEAFQERPVWTRRALLNHLGGKLRNWNELKKYLNYAAYQFKGGPWRDGVVPYGVDPRTDPKYRIYQTLMFKLPKQKRAEAGQTWKSLRKTQMGPTKEFLDELSGSHIFDGETYFADGKVWQVCDITDPLLKELFDNAAVRPTWDPNSGWYHGGLWAKVKAIMKTKLVAIQFGRHLLRSDFSATLNVGDMTPRTEHANFHLPLPNLNLTDEELTVIRGREPSRKSRTGKGYSVRLRNPAQMAERADQEALAQDTLNEEDAVGSDNEGSGSGSDEDDDSVEEEIYPEPPIFEGEGGDMSEGYEDMEEGVYPELE